MYFMCFVARFLYGQNLYRTAVSYRMTCTLWPIGNRHRLPVEARSRPGARRHAASKPHSASQAAPWQGALWQRYPAAGALDRVAEQHYRCALRQRSAQVVGGLTCCCKPSQQVPLHSRYTAGTTAQQVHCWVPLHSRYTAGRAYAVGRLTQGDRRRRGSPCAWRLTFCPCSRPHSISSWTT
eukprot:COSAG01_NODE_4268_length_5196_cov_4.984304_5_plen_181_part_00